MDCTLVAVRIVLWLQCGLYFGGSVACTLVAVWIVLWCM